MSRREARVLGRRMALMRSISALVLTTALIVGLLLPMDALAEFTSLPSGFEDEPFVNGVQNPTAIAWLPDGDLLIAEQSGDLLRAGANGQNLTDLDLPIAVCAQGERGLLGVAVDPEFGNEPGDIFVYYTASEADECSNRVSRFSLGPDNAIGDEHILIDGIPSPATNHNGGDLQFDRNGLLYVSVGDGGQGGNARRLDVLNGKILRIERDGSIPSGNPFTGSGSMVCGATGPTQSETQDVKAEKKSKKQKRNARKRKRKRRQNTDPVSACQEIFATGLRNPFRIAFASDDNDGAQQFYINDVGQGAWEEINTGQAGADYGWNIREGPCRMGEIRKCKRDKRFINPVHAYKHETTGCRSITGGAFVPNDGADWPDEYDDSYIYADFVCDKLFRLRGKGKNVSVQQFGVDETATHLTFGPDGALYYAAFGEDGEVRRITHNSS